MDIDKAADVIRGGGLVAFPTETVYGLGANALDAAAVDRIYRAKRRPATSPLIVHVSSMEMARSLTTRWPDSADALARRFWPGPLTLVLPKAFHVPDRVTSGLPTVGIRMPNHPIALRLIASAGVPIAAPSANRFTEVSPTAAGHVHESLGDDVDLILDGGAATVGIESTVLSLVDLPTLLRPGMVTREQIEQVIGPVSIAGAAAGEAHPAPGLHHKHYSPKTKVVLTSDLPSGRGAYLWRERECPAAAVNVRMPAGAEAYARDLYAVLRKMDAQQLDFIAVEPVPVTEEWTGIRDRLARAASED